jgi:hypothetical protein
MIDRRPPIRLSASLLLGGFITYVVVTLLHTGGPANNHEVIFDDYAGSDAWAIVHLGQFAAMAAIVAGLLLLSFALGTRTGGAAWVARLGAIAAGSALGLYGVLQAVDGVALKQAVDAWVSASGADKVARFANAETVRWLEWGIRSYQSYLFGLALILVGSAVALATCLPRTLGFLTGLSGLAYVVQGWVVGADGFSTTNSTAILAGYVFMLAWIVWLLVLAWRPRGAADRTESLKRSDLPSTAVRPRH